MRMHAQTSIATKLEFPATKMRDPWVPSPARPYTVEGIEFHSLKLIEAMTAVDEGKVLTKRLGAGQVRRPYGWVDKYQARRAASNSGMK